MIQNDRDQEVSCPGNQESVIVSKVLTITSVPRKRESKFDTKLTTDEFEQYIVY